MGCEALIGLYSMKKNYQKGKYAEKAREKCTSFYTEQQFSLHHLNP